MATNPEEVTKRAGPQVGAAVGYITREGQEHRSAFDSRHMVLVDAMINWQIANPGQPYSKMAHALQIGAITLRQLASTDAYKARFRELAPEMLAAVGTATLKEKIAAATEQALERMVEQIGVSNSLPDITDATEVLLQGIYGKGGAQAAEAPQPPTQQMVQVNVAIAAGREMMLGRAQPAPPLDALPQEPQP